MVGKLFDLSAQIGHHQRRRDVVDRVVIVHTNIHAQRSGSVVFIFRIKILGRDAATKKLADVVTVGKAHSYIAGAERPGFYTGDVIAFHGTIAKVLDAGRPSPMLTRFVGKPRSGKVAASQVTHVIQAYLPVVLRSQQSRILGGEVYVVVNHRHIAASQGVGVGRRSYVQEIVGLGAVLRRNCRCQQSDDE